MNIETFHPILVHFPIALLTIYAILECIRCRKILAKEWFFYMKAFLTIIGFLAGCAAFSTGPEGSAIQSWSGYAGIVGTNGRPLVRDIVSMHSTFAGLTLAIFGIIAFSYLMVWIEKECTSGFNGFKKYKIYTIALSVARFIQKPAIIISLAIVGFMAVLITGALGGAIVYGPNTDPFVSVIYHFFF